MDIAEKHRVYVIDINVNDDRLDGLASSLLPMCLPLDLLHEMIRFSLLRCRTRSDRQCCQIGITSCFVTQGTGGNGIPFVRPMIWSIRSMMSDCLCFISIALIIIIVSFPKTGDVWKPRCWWRRVEAYISGHDIIMVTGMNATLEAMVVFMIILWNDATDWNIVWFHHELLM
jgi:hypothetical protein